MMNRRQMLMRLNSLEEATVTGNPVAFNANVAKPLSQTLIGMEPVQDLHGQDSPWPAGGGINGFNVDSIVPFNSNVTVTKAGGSFTVENSNSYVAAMFCDAAAHSMQFPVTDGRYTISISEATTTSIGVYGSTDGVNFSWLANGITAGNTSATFTVSGQILIEFRANAPAGGSATIKNFMFEKGETSHSWSPYSNICPISGWTGCKVTRAGKNLFDKANANVINGYISAGKILSSSAHRTVYIPCKPNTTYVCSNSATDRKGLSYADEIPAYGVSVVTGSNGAVTTGANAKYLCLYCFNSNTDSGTFDDVLNVLQIELGQTATSYSTYSGESVEVTFPAVGKNLFSPSIVGGNASVTRNNVTMTLNATTGKYHLEGLANADGGFAYLRSKTVTLPAGTYYKAIYGNTHTVTLVMAKASNNTGIYGNPVTLSEDTEVYFGFNVTNGTDYNDDVGVMITTEQSTAYEPYTNTVYGGTVDLATGTVRAEYGYATFDGSSDEDWKVYATYNGFYIWIGNMKSGTRQNGYANWLHNDPGTHSPTGVWFGVGNTQVYVTEVNGLLSEVTLEAWREYLSSHNLQLCYPLATPITYTLTTAQITALIGDNTLWSDTNADCTITYLKKK